MADTTPELAQYQSDHDILIELRTEMRLLRDTLKTSFDGTKEMLTDHETRLRLIEKNGNRFLGRQSIVGALIGSGFALLCALVSALQIHVP
jgi:hypothetical protein